MIVKDKVVILTGASSGIGNAAALGFAKEGAKVYAVARRKERLENLAKEAEGLEGEIIATAGDVADEDRMKEIVQEVIDENGRIDVLVNNAGVLDDYQAPHNVKDETWDRVLNINVTSVMKLIRLVIPHMREQKSGVIVNTASVGGLNGVRGGFAYVASKHAIVGMTKHVGYVYADEGIRCVGVAPGAIGTEIGDTVKDPDMFTLEKFMPAQKIFPVMGEPENIGDVMVFLASDYAKFINGTTVVADGGWTAI